MEEHAEQSVGKLGPLSLPHPEAVCLNKSVPHPEPLPLNVKRESEGSNFLPVPISWGVHGEEPLFLTVSAAPPLFIFSHCQPPERSHPAGTPLMPLAFPHPALLLPSLPDLTPPTLASSECSVRCAVS